VLSSSGTDTYSSMAASLGSLKGPKHGGANVSCYDMMQAVIKEIGFTKDEEKIRDVVARILSKDFYDNSGLVYGMGHAVYTNSDPRAEILREYCRDLAIEKGRTEEFEFRVLFEKIAREMISQKTGKVTSNNVDYYSGFAYDMLNIPREIYTPLFACARTVGWLAHNIENKLYDGKIMRPATKYVGKALEFKPVEERK
jgi:citrate synthase